MATEDAEIDRHGDEARTLFEKQIETPADTPAAIAYQLAASALVEGRTPGGSAA